MDIHIAVVGLGFGSAFAPIYRRHPRVRTVTVVDRDQALAAGVAQRFGNLRVASSLEAVLADDDVDAVHVATPVAHHARQALDVLGAGKHCACAVPAATTLDELHALVAARASARRVYMMMETAVYAREFLMVEAAVRRGDFGRLQFLRGAHYQDMEGYPSYWHGLPPMWYATHAVGPLLRLADRRAERVHCLGSGTMRDELVRAQGNPFPIETALIAIAGGLSAEVTRTLFETPRAYSESFSVFGSDAVFEWQQLEHERPVRFAYAPGAGPHRHIVGERVEAPDRADLLPEPIRRFTRAGAYDGADPQRSFLFGGGHGGSHPHLVHEFISAIVEQRASSIDAATAAEWTAVGICAHASALHGGSAVDVPVFSSSPAAT